MAGLPLAGLASVKNATGSYPCKPVLLAASAFMRSLARVSVVARARLATVVIIRFMCLVFVCRFVRSIPRASLPTEVASGLNHDNHFPVGLIRFHCLMGIPDVVEFEHFGRLGFENSLRCLINDFLHGNVTNRKLRCPK